jgi:hypothetical protein
MGPEEKVAKVLALSSLSTCGTENRALRLPVAALRVMPLTRR